MDQISDKVAQVVHLATTAPRARVHDPEAIRHRWRIRRRRRAAATLGSAACLVAVVAAGAPPLADTIRDGAADPAAAAVGSQRLLLGPGGGFQVMDGRRIGFDQRPVVTEVKPDGSAVEHRVPSTWGETAGLPDGRLVGVTGHPPTHELVVLDPDGGVENSRRLAGDINRLQGATTREAYLLRGDAPESGGEATNLALVAHDLATGRERTVLTGEPLPLIVGVGDGLYAWSERRGPNGATAHYRASEGSCLIHVAGLSGGEARGSWAIRQCGSVRQARFSPDGRRLAVIHDWTSTSVPNDYGHKVTIFDVATGDELASEHIGRIIRHTGDEQRGGWKFGLAWVDDTRLLAAVAEIPEKPERLYRTSELLTVHTLTAG